MYNNWAAQLHQLLYEPTPHISPLVCTRNSGIYINNSNKYAANTAGGKQREENT